LSFLEKGGAFEPRQAAQEFRFAKLRKIKTAKRF
jgi:hypothetical protein